MYTLFTLFREYTYIHTIEGRRGIEHLTHHRILADGESQRMVCHHAPLKESRGRVEPERLGVTRSVALLSLPAFYPDCYSAHRVSGVVDIYLGSSASTLLDRPT